MIVEMTDAFTKEVWYEVDIGKYHPYTVLIGKKAKVVRKIGNKCFQIEFLDKNIQKIALKLSNSPQFVISTEWVKVITLKYLLDKVLEDESKT